MNSNREDYLQAIYRLSLEKGYTANKKIAEVLQVSKASVSEMMRKLEAEKLVSLQGTRIALTKEGKIRARHLLSDHRLWEYFLTEVLGMEKETAHDQAHLLEHVTGPQLRRALNHFLDYPEESPTGKVIYVNRK